MEVAIQENVVISVSFPKRKLKSSEPQNWTPSTKARAYLEIKKPFLNEKGTGLFKFSAPAHIQESINSEKVVFSKKAMDQIRQYKDFAKILESIKLLQEKDLIDIPVKLEDILNEISQEDFNKFLKQVPDFKMS